MLFQIVVTLENAIMLRALLLLLQLQQHIIAKRSGVYLSAEYIVALARERKQQASLLELEMQWCHGEM